MGKSRFKVGDKVKVIGLPTANYAPGVKDELGTEDLFRSMLGKIYTVRSFDKYRYIRLHPTRRDWIWIAPTFLKLRARKARSQG
jgi:hypothetical protein